MILATPLNNKILQAEVCFLDILLKMVAVPRVESVLATNFCGFLCLHKLDLLNFRLITLLMSSKYIYIRVMFLFFSQKWAKQPFSEQNKK